MCVCFLFLCILKFFLLFSFFKNNPFFLFGIDIVFFSAFGNLMFFLFFKNNLFFLFGINTLLFNLIVIVYSGYKKANKCDAYYKKKSKQTSTDNICQIPDVISRLCRSVLNPGISSSAVLGGRLIKTYAHLLNIKRKNDRYYTANDPANIASFFHNSPFFEYIFRDGVILSQKARKSNYFRKTSVNTRAPARCTPSSAADRPPDALPSERSALSLLFDPRLLLKKQGRGASLSPVFGAGGGGRTRTPLLAKDFESSSSANSNTPARRARSVAPGAAFFVCRRARGFTPPSSPRRALPRRERLRPASPPRERPRRVLPQPGSPRRALPPRGLPPSGDPSRARGSRG